jgi:hypothetical protein
MKGLFAVVAAALLLTGVQTYAQDAAAKADEKMSAKTMTAVGTVKSVAADSITVTDKDGKDWTFMVDKTTKVFAKGGSHMTAEKKANTEPVTISDAVKVGEKVNVKYHDMGEKKHAATVRVI